MSVLHHAQRARRSLLAGPVGVLPPTLPAQTQQLPATASWTLSNAKRQNPGEAKVEQPRRPVLLSVTAAGRGQAQVPQGWCDEWLRVHRPVRLRLPERSLRLPLQAVGR